MASKWRKTTLGEIAADGGRGLVDGPFGSNLPSSDYVSDGVPVIRGSNLTLGTARFVDEEFVFVSPATAERLSRSLCEACDIIFTKKGTLGQTGFVPRGHRYERFLLSSNQMKLSVDRSVANPLYVYYYVSSKEVRTKIVQDSTQTGVPKTNLAYLKDFPILLPPLADQQRIAGLLDALDNKIEQNRRTGRALDGLARATFKAWFVDFEPIKAKAAGAAGFPGMPPAAFADVPDRLTDSPLGPVPQGWDTPPFDELVSESKERVGDEDVPAYSSTNEGLLPRDERFKKDLSKSQSKNLLVRRGDLVFGLSREILNFGAMYDEVGGVSPAYKVFRQKATLLSPRFIETMIRQRVGYYRQVVKSSSREGQSVTADHFLRLAVLVPSEPVRQAFNRLENSTRQLIDQLDRESTRLAALRDYLLPRLLSGRVRVRRSQAEVKA